MRILLRLAALALMSSLAADAYADQSSPFVSVLLIKVAPSQDETEATLALVSTGGQGQAFILQAEHGVEDRLLDRIATLSPRVVASAQTRPSSESSTALEIYRGTAGITVRTKSVGVKGDRYKFWLGIQKSATGTGPLKVLDRTSIPVELAYGEALVTPAAKGLLLAVIPGHFESEEFVAATLDTPGMLTDLSRSELIEDKAREPVEESPSDRIVWDAAPGADIPDAEALKRILGE